MDPCEGSNIEHRTSNIHRPLSLIGMSGVGKSHWAKQLAQQGWLHLDCDAMIAQRLGELIEVSPDEDPVHAVGRWMGMPWTPGYAEREEQYLALEREVTEEALDTAAAQPPETHVVLDTTGSVIYTGEAILERLRAETRVVYFDAPPEVREKMVGLYLREPKPVLWRAGYQPEPGETQDAALARCYKRLLEDRSGDYRALAATTVAYGPARFKGFDLLALLNQP
ncbi:MAG: AAA family ATPase [Planctomycetota bacterium]